MRNQLTFHRVSTLDEAFAIALLPTPDVEQAGRQPTIMEQEEEEAEVGAGA